MPRTRRTGWRRASTGDLACFRQLKRFSMLVTDFYRSYSVDRASAMFLLLVPILFCSRLGTAQTASIASGTGADKVRDEGKGTRHSAGRHEEHSGSHDDERRRLRISGRGEELSEAEAVSRKSVELSGNRVRSRADWMAQTAKWREEPISIPGDRSALLPVTIAP